ncbi:STAS domain-containing protein [Streptomyces sp. NPDC058391]|uniref:STAS domain-containing protein n=1 Tax=Streptomyces sp. NPDC058391 TaxID=3346476 RepID=UPI0036461FA4
MDVTEPIVLVIAGRLTPADGPRLCEELAARLRETGGAEAICDVGGLIPPNLAAVDALARLRLTARRQGCRIRLTGAGRELRLLLDLVGLADLIQEVAPNGDHDPPDTSAPPGNVRPVATPSTHARRVGQRPE